MGDSRCDSAAQTCEHTTRQPSHAGHRTCRRAGLTLQHAGLQLSAHGAACKVGRSGHTLAAAQWRHTRCTTRVAHSQQQTTERSCLVVDASRPRRPSAQQSHSPMAILMSAMMPCRSSASSACFSGGGGAICRVWGICQLVMSRQKVCATETMRMPHTVRLAAATPTHKALERCRWLVCHPPAAAGQQSAPPLTRTACGWNRRPALNGPLMWPQPPVAPSSRHPACGSRGAARSMSWAGIAKRARHAGSFRCWAATWRNAGLQASQPARLTSACIVTERRKADEAATKAAPGLRGCHLPQLAQRGRILLLLPQGCKLLRANRAGKPARAGPGAGAFDLGKAAARQTGQARQVCRTRKQPASMRWESTCGPIFSYTLPLNTACSVSGTGRKLVRKSSARSQARSASRPPTAETREQVWVGHPLLQGSRAAGPTRCCCC